MVSVDVKHRVYLLKGMLVHGVFRVENVGVMGGKDRDATPVRIRPNGLVTWTPPTEISTSCEMLIAKYPFDTQVCSIVLLGWSYPLSEMNITAV